jgi:manganese/zinc/iron transport system permease protein
VGTSRLVWAWAGGFTPPPGELAPGALGYSLTEPGRRRAHGILRSHRLWESYLVREAAVCLGQSHALATRLEHVTDSSMQQRLGDTAPNDGLDPHGRQIPRQ